MIISDDVLIAESIGDPSNEDGADAWKNADGTDFVAGANDIVEEHVVKVTNAAYKTIESNGYQGRKGGEFFNKQRLYDINYPIEFFSSQTIQNVESSIINNFNTNSFLNIE